MAICTEERTKGSNKLATVLKDFDPADLIFDVNRGADEFTGFDGADTSIARRQIRVS